MATRPAEPADLTTLAALLERVGREVNTLQRKVDALSRRLPPRAYDAPIEYPWVKEYNGAVSDISLAKPERLAQSVRQCLEQTDAAVRDIQAATAKIDQLFGGDYLSADLKEWAKGGGSRW